MSGLLAQLLGLTASLRCVGGDDIELYRLRVWYAVKLILENPSLLPFDRSGYDGDLVAAAEEGERLAQELLGDGNHVTIVQTPWYRRDEIANIPSSRIGPFWTPAMELAGFDVLQSRSNEWVTVARRSAAPGGEEVLLVLPATSTLTADGRNIDVPAGSIRIAAALLVPGTAGFVGVRIARARIGLTANLSEIGPGGRWVLPQSGRLSLIVEPEQPALGNENCVLALPERLSIALDGTIIVAGAARLAVQGGTLNLTALGAPIAQSAGIMLPLDPGGAEFALDKLVPPLLRWQGRHPILSAGWLLPFAEGDLVSGDSADGGFVDLSLSGGKATAELTGTAMLLRLPECRVRLAAARASCITTVAEGSGTVDLSLWNGATSRFRIGKGRKEMCFAWNSVDEMYLTLRLGTLSNSWDLPRAADDRALQLPEPNVATLGLVKTTDGTWITTFDASVQSDRIGQLPTRGLALTNLYLPVQGPRRLVAGGRGNRFLAITGGQSWLKLDARTAEPMLPDPYAASWTLPRSDARAESAVDVLLRWTGNIEPAVQVQFTAVPPWPPPLSAPVGGGRADALFRNKFAADHATIRDRDLVLRLLDLSSHSQQFGIEIDESGLVDGRVVENLRLTLPMSRARLLMLPQVHWEPVRNLQSPGPRVIDNASQGEPTFIGGRDAGSVELLPEMVAARIVRAAQDGKPAAALFSLPFGLRAFANFGPDENPESRIPPASIAFHRPAFEGRFASATQLRLEAHDRMIPGRPPLGDARFLAGTLNSVIPPPGKQHVLADIRQMVDDSFTDGVPVHRLDLSGYGLSCFSRWRNDPDPDSDFVGVTQVRFDVLIGRTSYEVIEVRSYLLCCQSRVVRTIILDRTNAGVVERYDSGWNAIEDGQFNRYQAFDTGLVRRFSNIRNITVLDRPKIEFSIGGVLWQWETVHYDADAHLGEIGNETVAPLRGHIGYIPTAPVWKPTDHQTSGDPPPDMLTVEVLSQLLKTVGPTGGAANAQVELGKTLPFHATGIYADRAPRPGGAEAFVVAVNGTPSLSRVGQWNSVRITQDGEVCSVDPLLGIPVIRAPAGSQYRFREATEAYSQGDDFGFLMAMEGSRVLFPKPEIDPGSIGVLRTAAPELADAYALSQVNGWMPPRTRRLICVESAQFSLPTPQDWLLQTTNFTLQLADPALAGAAKWQLSRAFAGGSGLKLLLDSRVAAATPLKIERIGADKLSLDLPGLPAPLLTLVGDFVAELGKSALSKKPTVTFGPVLDEVRDVVDALSHFSGMPLPFDIEVNVVPGLPPAFEVLLHLRLRVPPKQHERIDIGVGKFSGQFDVTGRLRASLSGPAQGQLQLAFEGDLQQGIIPPVLFAGGYFRFAITISNSDDPRIELYFAATASVGGDLIPGLVALEVTVRYGYTLVPETLEPGVLLGLEARAKLLSGLLGLSFGTDAMARIKRVDASGITIFAELRVIATIEVLWGLDDEETELHTQFQQSIPLAVVAAVAAGNPLFLGAELL